MIHLNEKTVQFVLDGVPEHYLLKVVSICFTATDTVIFEDMWGDIFEYPLEYISEITVL